MELTKTYSRTCDCGKITTYANKYSYTKAEKLNRKCKQYAEIDIHPSMSMDKFERACPCCSDTISYSAVVYMRRAERHNRLCFSCTRKTQPKADNARSTETRKRMSISAKARVKRNGLTINYNPTACKIIENYGKKHGYSFRHAENGGEFHVPDTRYMVDGYDEDKNVVIEYLENRHKYHVAQDEKRKREIITQLGCTFIELKEWEN